MSPNARSPFASGNLFFVFFIFSHESPMKATVLMAPWIVVLLGATSCACPTKENPGLEQPASAQQETEAPKEQNADAKLLRGLPKSFSRDDGKSE